MSSVFSTLCRSNGWLSVCTGYISISTDHASIMYVSNLYVSKSVKTTNWCLVHCAVPVVSCTFCSTSVSNMTSGVVYTASNKRHMKCYFKNDLALKYQILSFSLVRLPTKSARRHWSLWYSYVWKEFLTSHNLWIAKLAVFPPFQFGDICFRSPFVN